MNAECENNYTSKQNDTSGLVDFVLSIGGVKRLSLRERVDARYEFKDALPNLYSSGEWDEYERAEGTARSAGVSARRGSFYPKLSELPSLRKDMGLLSTVHKSPFVEWREGASLFKVSRAIPQDAPKGGVKKPITGFSMSSRRRLMQTIASVKRDAILPMFVTLTYPNEFPEPRESKNHLEAFVKRLKRKFSDVGLIWKLEPQDRGAPHYHCLVWGCSQEELRAYVPLAWFEIAGNGDMNHLLFHMGALGNQPCVTEVHSFKGVWFYASKYLGKKFEVAGWDKKSVGRYWAVVNRSKIPFGDCLVEDIEIGQANHMMRYQKRFAKLKKRSYPSITIFCDADQWKKNLFREVLETV